MTIPLGNWSSYANTIAALPGLGATTLAAQIRTAGGAWNGRGLSGTPSLLVESAEHIAWRASCTALITDAYALATQIDGQTIPAVHPFDFPAQYRKALIRLKAASVQSTDQNQIRLATIYLSQPSLPTEPPQYTAAYYVTPPPAVHGRKPNKSNGALELALREALDAAETWQAL